MQDHPNQQQNPQMICRKFERFTELNIYNIIAQRINKNSTH
jgi:hypothetical protein